MTKGCECTPRHNPLLLDMPLVSRFYSSTASVGRNAQTHGKLPRRTPSSVQRSSQVFLACYGRHGSAFSSHDVPQDDGRLRRENKLDPVHARLYAPATRPLTLCAPVLTPPATGTAYDTARQGPTRHSTGTAMSAGVVYQWR